MNDRALRRVSPGCPPPRTAPGRPTLVRGDEPGHLLPARRAPFSPEVQTTGVPSSCPRRRSNPGDPSQGGCPRTAAAAAPRSRCARESRRRAARARSSIARCEPQDADEGERHCPDRHPRMVERISNVPDSPPPRRGPGPRRGPEARDPPHGPPRQGRGGARRPRRDRRRDGGRSAPPLPAPLHRPVRRRTDRGPPDRAARDGARPRAQDRETADAQPAVDGDRDDRRRLRLPRPHVLQPAVGRRHLQGGHRGRGLGHRDRYRGRLQLANLEAEILGGDERDLVHTGRITPVHRATGGITTRTIPSSCSPRSRGSRRSPIRCRPTSTPRASRRWTRAPARALPGGRRAARAARSSG